MASLPRTDSRVNKSGYRFMDAFKCQAARFQTIWSLVWDMTALQNPLSALLCSMKVVAVSTLFWITTETRLGAKWMPAVNLLGHRAPSTRPRDRIILQLRDIRQDMCPNQGHAQSSKLAKKSPDCLSVHEGSWYGNGRSFSPWRMVILSLLKLLKCDSHVWRGSWTIFYFVMGTWCNNMSRLSSSNNWSFVKPLKYILCTYGVQNPCFNDFFR